jgi:hypothetical protein
MKLALSLLGALITLVSLIDVPGQIARWIGLFGSIDGTYISAGAAVIGLSIIVAANFEWLRDRFHKPDRAPTAVPERAPALPTEPNMRLADVLRRVLRRADIAGSTEADAQAFLQALRTIQEKAHLSLIDVFGGVGLRTINPQDWGELMRVRIAPEFWADNEIDAFQFMNDERGTTRNLADDPRAKRYYGIWFDRRQIDTTWLPEAH